VSTLNLDKVLGKEKELTITDVETNEVLTIKFNKIPLYYNLKLQKIQESKKGGDGAMLDLLVKLLKEVGKPAKTREWIVMNLSGKEIIATMRYLLGIDEGDEPKKKVKA